MAVTRPVRGANLVLWHRDLTQIDEDLDILLARGYDGVAFHHTRYTYTEHDRFPVPRRTPKAWGTPGRIYDEVGQDPEHRKRNTVHPAVVLGALNKAVAKGFRVVVNRPSLDPAQEGWRGFLTFKDVYNAPNPPRWDVADAFLREYWLAVVKPELDHCRATDTTLSLGLEMRGLTMELGDTWLRDLVRKVRTVTKTVPLTYSANHSDEALALYDSGFVAWFLAEHPANTFGIDWYPQLTTEPTRDIELLQHLTMLKRAYHGQLFALGERVYLGEVGYPAIPEASVHPEGVAEDKRPPLPDYEIQALCFGAFAQVFSDVGAFVWQAQAETLSEQHNLTANPGAQVLFLGR